MCARKRREGVDRYDSGRIKYSRSEKEKAQGTWWRLVPKGGCTCYQCMAIASNGYKFKEAFAPHNGCDCQPMQGAKGEYGMTDGCDEYRELAKAFGKVDYRCSRLGLPEPVGDRVKKLVLIGLDEDGATGVVRKVSSIVDDGLLTVDEALELLDGWIVGGVTVGIEDKLDEAALSGLWRDATGRRDRGLEDVFRRAVASEEPYFFSKSRKNDVIQVMVELMSVPGMYNISMHGTQRTVEMYEKQGVSPSFFANVIRRREDYHGEEIMLWSCSTGKVRGDGSCFAKELADELGVTVHAPIDTLYALPGGSFRVGCYGRKNDYDDFTVFEPGKGE